MSEFRASRMATDLARYSRRPVSHPSQGLVAALHKGDPNFDTPHHIKTALTEAIDRGVTHYAAQTQGDPELREALASDLAARVGVPVVTDQVLVTGGANPGVTSSILACVDPGDRVVIPEPTYSLYADVVHMAGAEPVFVGLANDFHLDLEKLAVACAGARMIILCHPCNPTGVVYRLQELKAVADIAERAGALVLMDEAYDHIVFDGYDFVSSLQIKSLQERLIYCQTLSKTFAMTGWRIGYTFAPVDIAAHIALVHVAFAGTVNSAVQKAALVAVTTPTTWPQDRLIEYQSRRDLVLEMLDGIPGLRLRAPEGTFYVFPAYSQPIASVDMARLALDRGVGVRAGIEYGPSGEGHIRIAFSADREQLAIGLERLRELFLDDSIAIS
jgi:aspartate/methionine/tyrosine aminotransferase